MVASGGGQRQSSRSAFLLLFLLGLVLLLGSQRLTCTLDEEWQSPVVSEASRNFSLQEEALLIAEEYDGVDEEVSNNPQETTEDQSLKAKAHQIVLQQHIATAKLRAKKGAHLDTVLFRGRHPALAPLLSEMAPMKIWATTTVADLNIAGLPKAGTSHFYRILTTHAHATVFDPLTKEQCVKLSLDDKRLIEGWDLEPFRDEATDRQRMIQLGLKRFHRGQHKRVSHSPATNKTTVNGCIYYPDVELSWFYVRPPASKKYFFLFRDPADWLWASYNFWQDAVYDPGSFDKEYEGRGFWINDKEHYRSPEMFHEFIASGTKTRMGARMISFRDWTVAYPRRLRAMVSHRPISK